ncbi:MAG: acyl-CoA thioesterase [Bacteroidales bacterium]
METYGKFSYNFTVDQDLLDDYGHVNNARYLDLYEEARWDILNQSGYGQEMVKKSRKGPVILEVTVRFKSELLPGQKIRIETSSRRRNEIIFYFDQVMINEEGKEVSMAVFTCALFDLEKRKMIKPDEDWQKAFGFG